MASNLDLGWSWFTYYALLAGGLSQPYVTPETFSNKDQAMQRVNFNLTHDHKSWIEHANA
jgi:hypothetical protein